jgi:hypothetical protein
LAKTKINSASFHKGQLKLVDTIQKTILAELKNIKTGKPMDVFLFLMIWLFKLLSNQFSI